LGITGAGFAPEAATGLAAADEVASAGGWPCDGLPGFGGGVLAMDRVHFDRRETAVAPCKPVHGAALYSIVSNVAVANVRWTV